MKILVLAGGADQVALIKELYNRGHEVILLDYLENPPAKFLVKHHIQESTLDSEKVKECALSEKVDLICTACTDQALLTVAKVSEELNLPCYISYEKALAVTNKRYMKKRMIEFGIPTSKFVTLNSISDFEIIKDLTYPLVVKPADCNSSKGVIKVNNSQECFEFAGNALKLSRTSTAIVEEFKSGDEISADFYIDGETPIFLSASTSVKIKGTKGFTITGSVYPAITDEHISKLTDIAYKISQGFGLTDTPLLIQLIKSDNELFVIEFSARMGGGSKYRLIQEISGVNIMSCYVDLILGKKPSITIKQSDQQIRMLYIYTRPGIVKSIQGVDSLKKLGYVKEVFMYKTLNTEVTKAETSGDRVMGLLITAETAAEMQSRIKEVNSSLTIIDENGEDIMMHNLLME